MSAIQRAVDLTSCTTLALPGRASAYLRVAQPAQLQDCPDGPRFVLGGGSNVVVTGDFDGLVLHMAIPGRRLAGEDAEAWYVEAGAGENWHDLVCWTLDQGWPGLENLALIPGTVGAAPIQNIGAYGLELEQRFHSLTAYDFDTGQLIRFDHRACRFGYRDSIFKREGWHQSGRLAIVAVTLRLPKAWTACCAYSDVAAELAHRRLATPDAKDIAAAIVAIRQRKLPDPTHLANAGSFFHNPVVTAAVAERLGAAYPALPRYPQADGRVKLAAGWLIEAVGWKGRDLGPVGMYAHQALVLVNRGGASGADVLRTMAAVQADVRRQFGIELTPEPVFL